MTGLVRWVHRRHLHRLGDRLRAAQRASTAQRPAPSKPVDLTGLIIRDRDTGTIRLSGRLQSPAGATLPHFAPAGPQPPQVTR